MLEVTGAKYPASYDGQGAVAMRAGKDYAKLTGDSFYEVLTLLRFGRFDEILQVTRRPTAVRPTTARWTLTSPA